MNQQTNPIRVAQIVGKMVGGGVESFIMNYYRNIDKTKIQFDFFVDIDSTDIPREEIISMGGRVIEIPPYQKLFKYIKVLRKILKENKYEIIHSHINTLSVFPLYCAYKEKIPVRIAHSHSTSNKKEYMRNILKKVLKNFSKIFATHYFACSEHAGKWLFGNRTFEKGKVTIINNAIDVEKFKYNEKIRNEKRKELNIKDDELVIGHIGRFVTSKNQEYLIDVFNEIHKKNDKAILLLVGKGPLMNEIKEKVKQLGLTNFVKFLGQCNNVNELYQAIDVFVLPSLYEGLGMVLIEAQCAGCYTIASTEVPQIVKFSDNIDFFDLCINPGIWAKSILNKIDKYNRQDQSKKCRALGYDIRNEVKRLEEYYISINK